MIRRILATVAVLGVLLLAGVTSASAGPNHHRGATLAAVTYTYSPPNVITRICGSASNEYIVQVFKLGSDGSSTVAAVQGPVWIPFGKSRYFYFGPPINEGVTVYSLPCL